MHKQTYDGVETTELADEEDILKALRDPNTERVTIERVSGGLPEGWKGKYTPKDAKAKRKKKRKAQKASRKKNR